MATVIKQTLVDAPIDAVWDAVADFGAVHTRFAPGFVTNVELVPGARLVTFGDGSVARELFLGVDHAQRRLAYSIASERFTHHSAGGFFFASSPKKSFTISGIATRRPNEVINLANELAVR